jgi:hypothetical protein
MQHSLTNGTGTVNPESTRTIVTGASLAHRQLDKRQLAVLAADILDGRIWLQPSQKQLAALLSVSGSYIGIARSLSPAMREAIMDGRDGTPFRTLTPTRQLPLPGFKTVTGHGVVEDRELVQLAHSVGADRMLLAAVKAEQGLM